MNKKTFFTVGPSQLYPTYEQHMQQALALQIGSISHRSAAFRDMYKKCDEQLRQLMGIPHSHKIFFTSSATEIWERMIQNTVQHKSAHFVSGAFGKKFADFASALGKQTQVFESAHGEGFPNAPEYKLDKDVELICTTQNETSTGVQFPVHLYEGLRIRCPKAIICADIVSSAPYVQLDYNIVDAAFFSVQKAFGLAAGLGVWIINDACIAKSKTVQNLFAHQKLSDFEKHYANFETPSTPNTLGIYMLSKIVEDMNGIGIENIRATLTARAQQLYQVNTSILKPLVSDTAVRSNTTIVYTSTINASEWNKTLDSHNFVVGSGYGAYKNSEIRIANFPAIEKTAFDGLLTELLKER